MLFSTNLCAHYSLTHARTQINLLARGSEIMRFFRVYLFGFSCHIDNDKTESTVNFLRSYTNHNFRVYAHAHSWIFNRLDSHSQSKQPLECISESHDSKQKKWATAAAAAEATSDNKIRKRKKFTLRIPLMHSTLKMDLVWILHETVPNKYHSCLLHKLKLKVHCLHTQNTFHAYLIDREIVAFGNFLVQFFDTAKTRNQPSRTAMGQLAMEHQLRLQHGCIDLRWCWWRCWHFFRFDNMLYHRCCRYNICIICGGCWTFMVIVVERCQRFFRKKWHFEWIFVVLLIVFSFLGWILFISFFFWL